MPSRITSFQDHHFSGEMKSLLTRGLMSKWKNPSLPYIILRIGGLVNGITATTFRGTPS
jgi:hypothetical protein